MRDTSNCKKSINVRKGGSAKDDNHHHPPPDSFNTYIAASATASKTTTTNDAKDEKVCKGWSNKSKKKNECEQETVN